MGSDSTNLNAGCHGPVPLETGARSEDGANHSRIFRRSITSRAITKARFVCSTAAIRSATQRTSRPFRGRWVNRRPLGHEPTPGPHCNRLLPIKAAETRASPSPPLGSDRRLLEGVPAQFPHNQGSLVSSRRATIREAGPKLSANLDALVSSIFIPSASSRRFSTGASLLDPVLALACVLVSGGLSVGREL